MQIKASLNGTRITGVEISVVPAHPYLSAVVDGYLTREVNVVVYFTAYSSGGTVSKHMRKITAGPENQGFWKHVVQDLTTTTIMQVLAHELEVHEAPEGFGDVLHKHETD